MYDYVIVGGGSAGCALAARLSEDPSVSVCLIEAGPADTSDVIHVPSQFGRLFRTSLDWDYDSHEEPFLEGRRIYLPRGRVLGGSSSMNAGIYLRNSRLDYDRWGEPGWNYDDVLPYFLRSEDNERGASAYHGAGGPLGVSDGRSENPVSAAFVAAGQEAGFARNDDFNGPSRDGFGFFQVTQRDGRRCSAAVAFLHPAANRPNLTVELNLQVHRVLVEGGRATGVAGRRLDEEITIRAGREVVLCGGAYNSPQLLMLSGIGPADHLRQLGVPVAVDNPAVGANLQDHVLVPLILTLAEPVSLLMGLDPRYQRQFVEEGRGPLTSNGPEAGGFVRTRPELAEPDVGYFAAPVMFLDAGLSAPAGHAITYGPCVLRPESSGRVMLASADPTAKPKIEHGYFAAEADVAAAMAGLRIGLDIARTQPLAGSVSSFFRAPDSESDADLRSYIRRYAHSLFDVTGGCALGSVVDAELRVMGVDALRVVDASVMPEVGGGTPNASVIMIAERAADLMRGLRSPEGEGAAALPAGR
ncbi:choline dehydrogenase [Microtetraspora sp. NBRC 13810]|uniref:GMC family oxidoreductase n=1 Tax=Microtetraspora sp. NBRC 13810 TaxID=3030990 RepID=UPI0024A0E64B|nr:GMC family oxidoreductase N-terminal domain-containing protein [Microtetraspora sp. NBRC 13810]GLW05800.1 choline dehydrogenase [Microtetraspora sp. NBRC 13810]